MVSSRRFGGQPRYGRIISPQLKSRLSSVVFAGELLCVIAAEVRRALIKMIGAWIGAQEQSSGKDVPAEKLISTAFYQLEEIPDANHSIKKCSH